MALCSCQDCKSFSNCKDASAREKLATILLVEDEPFLREATSSILEKAGFDVLSAEDAPQAINVYAAVERRVHLVVTDMVLPGKTGQELGKELRQLCPEVKILITSGYSDAETETEDPSMQTYFLAKPYSRRSLVEKIGTILGELPTQYAQPQAV